MNDHLRQSEDIIQELVNSEFGEKYSLACRLADIQELESFSFSKIQKWLSSGEAIIRVAPISMDDTTFQIISTPFEKQLSNAYSLLMFLGPIAGVILAFVYSWYWLVLAVAAPVVSIRLIKKTYLHALFNRAYNSETVFSYLFTAGKVTIELPEEGLLYRVPG